MNNITIQSLILIMVNGTYNNFNTLPSNQTYLLTIPNETSIGYNEVSNTEAIVSALTNATSIGETEANLPSNKYQLVEKYLGWLSATLYCKEHGMNLATINSWEDKALLAKIIIKQNGYQIADVWVNGMYIQGQTVWLSTMQPIDGVYFWVESPGTIPDHNCLLLQDNHYTVDHCDKRLKFICEQ